MKLLLVLGLLTNSLCLASGLDYIGVRTQTPTLEFDISSKEVDGVAGSSSENKIDYLSREPVILGVFASIAGIGFSISKNVEDEEGKSEYFDLDFTWYGERFGGRLAISEMEDFFVHSGEGTVDLDQLSDEELENEGVFLQNLSLDIMATVISFRLSLASAFEPSHHPKESGGGIISIFTGDWTYLDGPSFVIPESLQGGFGDDGDLLEGTFQSANLQLGWAQTLVMGPLYLSVLAAMGPGVTQVSYETETEELELNLDATKTTLKGVIGVSSKDFFMAGEVDYRSQDYSLTSMDISTLRTSLSFSVGLSF